MQALANSAAAQKTGFVNGTANADATITIAAVADEFHVIDSIHLSVDGAVTTGEFLVKFAGSRKLQLHTRTAAAGIFEFLFPRGLYTGTVNEEVLVVSEALGAGISAMISVTYR